MSSPQKSWTARRNRTDLEEANAPDDPLALFERWFGEALAADLVDASAMTLATADAGGRPSARTVLLKGFGAEGFRFYTNYDSRKAHELEGNPHAALAFWWDRLERQVRIEGPVKRLRPEISDEYFATRPRGSQLGAHASPQSRVIGGRAELENALEHLSERYGDGSVPRPPNWGGYAVLPETIEFWQGRGNRLHDRLRYTRRGDGWKRERLAP
jgi:pyridoxamine 5'-phosphate oxidase